MYSDAYAKYYTIQEAIAARGREYTNRIYRWLGARLQ